MDPFKYQRLVIGYHGCDQKVRDSALLGKSTLRASENAYDWLGRGIYFWEYGKERAFEWAKEQQTRGKITNPAVLGAVLHLGQCFDLLDVQYTRLLGVMFPDFVADLKASGHALPENRPLHPNDADFLLRPLDCAVVNFAVKNYEIASSSVFQSVRGVFQEGDEAFPHSYIRSKSHIQIAVRDTSCILGYFLPQ